MTTYTFSFPLANAVLEEMDGINKNIVNTLADLETNVQGCLQDWTSEARSAYDLAKQHWDASAEYMPVLLEQARAALNRIADEYHVSEKTGVAIWEG